jgi:hypothetical protein
MKNAGRDEEVFSTDLDYPTYLFQPICDIAALASFSAAGSGTTQW